MSFDRPHVPVEISGVPAHWQSLRDWIRKVAQTLNALAVSSSSGFSPGDVKAFCGTVQQGWVLADGSTLSRRENSALFAVIGVTFGAGDGVTTFNLPDLRNKLLIGAGSIVSLGQAAGNQFVVLNVDQLPAHTHDVVDNGHNHSFSASPHSHTITDPGHSHAASDPGHAHDAPEGGFVLSTDASGDPLTGLDAPSELQEIGIDDIVGKVPGTDTATTGITIGTANTGIEIDASDVSGDVGMSTVGITIAETGEAKPINVLPPVVGINWLIKL